MFEKLSTKLHVHRGKTFSRFVIWCPGCKRDHHFDVRNDGQRSAWSWNEDVDSPSFTPSLRYPEKPRCHLTLTAGLIHFYEDCDHELAGKNALMESLEHPF